ncbi:LexA family transcriptional regulator [Novosphingobium capsulatum]|uniref:LexA family transcriptional regulator n=1 Tax=Novosphingobium capsulatum TaxID=13688 RepID=UPI000A02E6F9|nr:XRE family transcriptional regulator [Novosphingobium capsulatum]WQD92744.1 S24 family peptidase [Novosphingobium capsulatum]
MTETTGSKLIALRSRAGMTLKEIAKAADMKGPSSVQAYFSAEYSKPLTPPVATRLASAMAGRGDPPIQPSELYELTGFDWAKGNVIPLRAEQPGADRDRAVPRKVPDPDAVPAENLLTMEAPTLRGQPKDVPAYASALAADLQFDTCDNGPEPVEMTIFQMSDVIAHVRRPPGISNGRAVYVVFVSGSSMEPRYQAGDPVFVDPKRPPAIGDDVVVQLVADDGGEIVTGLIKRLVKRSATFLDLEQYNPPIRFRVPMERIAHIHRVIPWAECFGI